MRAPPARVGERHFRRLIPQIPDVRPRQQQQRRLPFQVAFIDDLAPARFGWQARQKKAAQAGFRPRRKAARSGAAHGRLPRGIVIIGHVICPDRRRCSGRLGPSFMDRGEQSRPAASSAGLTGPGLWVMKEVYRGSLDTPQKGLGSSSFLGLLLF